MTSNQTRRILDLLGEDGDNHEAVAHFFLDPEENHKVQLRRKRNFQEDEDADYDFEDNV